MKLPVIEENGTFSEVDLVKMSLTDDHLMKVKPIVMARDSDMFQIESDYYKRKLMSFKIDEFRIAEVSVYVHTKFLGHIPHSRGLRDRELDRYVQENAPWVFSYAKRVILNSIRELGHDGAERG